MIHFSRCHLQQQQQHKKSDLHLCHISTLSTQTQIQSQFELEFHCFYLEITWKIHVILCHQRSGNPELVVQSTPYIYIHSWKQQSNWLIDSDVMKPLPQHNSVQTIARTLKPLLKHWNPCQNITMFKSMPKHTFFNPMPEHNYVQTCQNITRFKPMPEHNVFKPMAEHNVFNIVQTHGRTQLCSKSCQNTTMFKPLPEHKYVQPLSEHNCVQTRALYIFYFNRYDTYHDTHEVIFDMYQQYILSGFDMSTNFMGIWEF